MKRRYSARKTPRHSQIWRKNFGRDLNSFITAVAGVLQSRIRAKTSAHPHRVIRFGCARGDEKSVDPAAPAHYAERGVRDRAPQSAVYFAMTRKIPLKKSIERHGLYIEHPKNRHSMVGDVHDGILFCKRIGESDVRAALRPHGDDRDGNAGQLDYSRHVSLRSRRQLGLASR